MSERESTRKARIETDHDSPAQAAAIARTLAPDNTAEMETTTDGSQVVTTIERERTGSLQATADDYVVNLQVAVQLTTTDGETSTTTDNT